MATALATLTLGDIVISVYSALDDVLRETTIPCVNGKLIPRPGPLPEIDDQEFFCLAVLQELFGFESDHFFYQWLESNSTMTQLFPRRLSRLNWADRHALLTSRIQRLSQAFVDMDSEGHPLFSRLTPIPSMSAVPFEQAKRNSSANLPEKDITPH